MKRSRLGAGQRRMRLHAIARALWFGVLPWWLYENEPHYDCGYWPHLALNLGYALRWASRRETEADRRFEREVNGEAAR